MATHQDVVEEQRIRCEHTKRVIATVVPDGVTVWCRYKKTVELIPWDVIDAARAKVQGLHQEHNEAC